VTAPESGNPESEARVGPTCPPSREALRRVRRSLGGGGKVGPYDRFYDRFGVGVLEVGPYDRFYDRFGV